ncbi:MAG: uridine kinase [Pirellulaceae bacterium]
MKPLLIGISGGSGAGKSTLIRGLQTSVAVNTSILAMDDYYKDQSDIPIEQRTEMNYDSLEAVDISLFVSHLDALKSSTDIAAPVYDFQKHTRSSATQTVAAEPLIFLDGIMLLAVEEIRSRLDLSVFIEVDTDTRLSRRFERDQKTRGRSRESVESQWRETVQPFFESTISKARHHADLILQNQDFSRLLKVLELFRAT